jgi:hypothetical protein
MIRRFLLWLTARLPVKVIGRDAPYVEWYHVATLFGLARIQIHRFLRSDPDGLHDHPWGWARSFVLAGWYLEERRDRTRVRAAFSTYGMTGDTFHRVILPAGAREVWTLFVHGPYVKHWGFITPATMKAVPGEGLRPSSWHDRERSIWEYNARARSHSSFDPWPNQVGVPRGRDLRRPADAPTHFCPACRGEYFQAGFCDWCPDRRLEPGREFLLAPLE